MSKQLTRTQETMKTLYLDGYNKKKEVLVRNNQTCNSLILYKGDDIIYEAFIYEEMSTFLKMMGIDLNKQQIVKAVEYSVTVHNKMTNNNNANDIIQVFSKKVEAEGYTLYRNSDLDSGGIETLAYTNLGIDITE